MCIVRNNRIGELNMNCNNCGNPIAPGSTACSVCGTPVANVNNVVQPTPVQQPVPVQPVQPVQPDRGRGRQGLRQIPR